MGKRLSGQQLRPDGRPRFCSKGFVLQWIATSALAKHANPFKGCWRDVERPISMREVDACLAAGEEQMHSPTEWGDEPRTAQERERRRAEHVQKIAWFVQHGFQEPLEVDVDVPSLGCHVRHMVTDGNHRLAAAIYRANRFGEDPVLPLSVGGSIDYAIELGLWVDDEFTRAERAVRFS